MARLTILVPLHCCDCSGSAFAWLPDWMPLNEGCPQPPVMFHCCISQQRLIIIGNGSHFRMVLTVHLCLIILLCLWLSFTFYPYQIKTIYVFLLRAEDLDYVLYRVGMLAVLRSKSKGGKLHNRKLKCAMESYT